VNIAMANPPATRRLVTIVGGGLAGLALGIGLRQRGVPVLIYEAGHYPRHRVCGEFLSGRGLDVLGALGLREAIEQAGATRARTAQFFIGDRALPARELPEPALCLSRHVLDARMADHFRRLGGELRCDSRWAPAIFGQGVVRATGRRPRAGESAARWYGLKAHARNVELQADLEMHFAGNSYVGLCRLPGGEVNISGLFRRTGSETPLPRNVAGRLCAESSSALSDRLRQAEWDADSFSSVGGLPFRDRIRAEPGGICIGDALAMIPPVTGNGMSMALESASLALNPVTDFAEGRVSWEAASCAVARSCRGEFGARLRRAGWLHSVLFHPAARRWLVPRLVSSEMIWRMLFRTTR
jgi:2-polyprenyl-6-methoxyphenol hydroxylase-like FAD-dependent oxidoreductase